MKHSKRYDVNIRGKVMPFNFFCKKVFDEVYNRVRFQLSKLISDRNYVERKYSKIFGEELNFAHPQNFNEKLNWLKLYDRRPEYTVLADKLLVRRHVADRIGDNYLVPVIGSWRSPNEIDFEKLPEQFVLKCTHDSASVCVCKDKEKFDKVVACRKLANSLKKNYYWYSREWVYKYASPQIIAEEYLEDESGKELKDYKIFCFNGEPKLIQVDFGRFTKHERNMYTPQWDIMDMTYNYPRNINYIVKKPDKLEEMLFLARKLSEGIPFVRTDFYSVYDKIFFGEMTFYPEAGFGKFYPEEWNNTLGSWIELPCEGK